MITMEEMLTPKDIARILRITDEAARDLLNRGEIEGFKLSGRLGRWRIKPEALQRFVEKQQTEKQQDKK